MGRAYHGRLGLAEPPHWVVATVRFCMVGMLMLPFTTVAWLVACSLWPAQTAEMAPVAFAATVTVAVCTFGCVAFLIGNYPPVRGDGHPRRR